MVRFSRVAEPRLIPARVLVIVLRGICGWNQRVFEPRVVVRLFPFTVWTLTARNPLELKSQAIRGRSGGLRQTCAEAALRQACAGGPKPRPDAANWGNRECRTRSGSPAGPWGRI